MVLLGSLAGLFGPSFWARADELRDVERAGQGSQPAVGGAVAPEDVDAEPVSPDTVRREPHLAPYAGHILIRALDWQVVLAGVPSIPPSGTGDSAWQPTVLAAYARSKGVWTRRTALQSLELKTNEAGTMPYPIAVDLGRDREQKAAYATFVYGVSVPGKPPASRQVVTWRLDGTTGALVATFDRLSDEGRPKSPAPVLWPLRWRGAGAWTGDSLGSGRSPPAQVPYRLLSRGVGADFAALLSYRPVAVSDLGDALELAPQTTVHGHEKPPIEGFEVLLGRAGAALALGRADALQACLYGVDKPRKALRDEAKLPWILSCANTTQVPRATLTVAMAPEDVGADLVPQPLYIFRQDGQAVLYAPVTSKSEPVVIALTPGVAYRLADTPNGRLIGDDVALTLKAGDRQQVALPPRRAGFLRLLGDGPNTAPALVRIGRIDRTENAVLRSVGNGDNALLVAPHTWLVKRWPVDIELLEGGYSVSAVRGNDGRACRQDLTIHPGRRLVLTCNGDGFLRQSLGAGPFADLAWSKAAPLAKLTPTWTPALISALGIDLVTAERAAGKAAPQEPKSGLPRQLPALTAVTGDGGVSLRFFPATGDLATRWHKAQRDDPQGGPAALARFVADEAAVGLLELGCPGPGISLADVPQIVQELKPTALGFFGCRPEQRDQFYALWGRLAAQSPKPLLLTAVSTLKSLEEGPFLPRINLTAPKAAQATDEELGEQLSAGEFTVSAGAVVRLVSLRLSAPGDEAAAVAKDAPEAKTKDKVDKADKVDKVRPKARWIKPSVLEVVVEVTAAAGVEPRDLGIFTERGLLRRVVVPPPPLPAAGTNAPPPHAGGYRPTRLHIPVPSLADASWLRLELRGDAPSLVPSHEAGGDGAVLAVTNYVPVASLRTAEKESH